MSADKPQSSEKLISELRLFMKKVLVNPDLIAQSLAITREHIDEENADSKIAEHISAKTSIRIPSNPSEADLLFIGVLKEVVRDEKALY